MGRGRQAGTVTHWIPVVGIQLAALLLLQACKIDRASGPEAKSENVQNRAVFGSGPGESPPDESRNRSIGRTTEPAKRPNRTPQTQPSPPPSEPPRESRPSGISDPGERRVGDAGPIRQPDPVADRFLHYQPPGSIIGDTGELKRRTAEAQPAVSNKSIAGLIRRWADTLLAGDFTGHMGLYASNLDRFGVATNVSREIVRASKQRLLRTFAGVRRFEIYDLRIRQTNDGSISAEFRIESDVAQSGSPAWYRLIFREHRGEWKIYSEEKLQPVSRRNGR